jgi:uncharacterized protein (DUF2126 family)
MNLVQNLLVRALVAKFWKEPYEKKLIRWELSCMINFTTSFCLFRYD